MSGSVHVQVCLAEFLTKLRPSVTPSRMAQAVSRSISQNHMFVEKEPTPAACVCVFVCVCKLASVHLLFQSVAPYAMAANIQHDGGASNPHNVSCHHQEVA